MDYSYSTSTSTSSPAAMGAFVVVWLFAVALIALPAIITQWKLFSKAGKPGWAALIPVYNTITMAQIGGKPVWMGVLASVLAMTGAIPILGFFTSIAAFVFGIMILVAFIKSYNAGSGFWVLFILLPIVAVFMTKDVAYTGPAVAEAAAPAPGVGYGPQQPVAPAVPYSPVPTAPVAPAAPVEPVQPPQQPPVVPPQPPVQQ